MIKKRILLKDVEMKNTKYFMKLLVLINILFAFTSAHTLFPEGRTVPFHHANLCNKTYPLISMIVGSSVGVATEILVYRYATNKSELRLLLRLFSVFGVTGVLYLLKKMSLFPLEHACFNMGYDIAVISSIFTRHLNIFNAKKFWSNKPLLDLLIFCSCIKDIQSLTTDTF
jgi:hypothetical protein